MAIRVKHWVRALVCGVAAGGLSACGQYAVNLNGQRLYTPPPLFADYFVADAALKDCLRSTILENNITQVERITQLRCPHSGITSLEGLERFTHLKVLDVSNNPLRSITPLFKLPQLQQINLNNINAADCNAVDLIRQKDVSVLANACP